VSTSASFCTLVFLVRATIDGSGLFLEPGIAGSTSPGVGARERSAAFSTIGWVIVGTEVGRTPVINLGGLL
jgi:hypothetical protein